MDARARYRRMAERPPRREEERFTVSLPMKGAPFWRRAGSPQ
jgi:hypothetical protein